MGNYVATNIKLLQCFIRTAQSNWTPCYWLCMLFIRQWRFCMFSYLNPRS